jgi:phosphoribosyl 1,2-cyclic phosphodiesterase
VQVRFWGVRGSFATPGSQYLRYGGNTTAIEVRSQDGHRVLVDLGTGATEFAKELMSAEFSEGKGHLPILLTHTHIDHIMGLPFFTPFFIPGNDIRILGGESTDQPLSSILQGQLDGHYSPLYGLENLAAGVHVDTLEPGSGWPVEGFEVTAMQAPHGGTTVHGYRIEADGRSVVIMTDVEHADSGPMESLLEGARGCDLLVHDAMFSNVEYQMRRGWGHSSVRSALSFARQAEVGRLALFHHNPDSTDSQIDALVAEASASTEITVFAAQEGIDVAI